MKKIFALVIAIALTLALAVPALADGEDAAVFGTELNLVANDPQLNTMSGMFLTMFGTLSLPTQSSMSATRLPLLSATPFPQR